MKPGCSDMEDIFLDIHMHAMDLSHPDLPAFINRVPALVLMRICSARGCPLLTDKTFKGG